MKIKLVSLIFLIASVTISAVILFPPKLLIAKSSCNENMCKDSKDSDCLSKLIDECQAQVDQQNSKEATLSSEIQYADNQIYISELKIQNTTQKLADKEASITKLTGSIADLITRMDKLGKSAAFQETVLNERMRARYKSLETSPIIILLGSDTLNKLVQKTEYLKIMELQDHKLITQMNDTKKAYAQQKILYEDTKAKEESLKQQIIVEKANLESYQNQLEDQKVQKQKLLADTQNDEAKYQQLLDDAQRELNQIVGAVSVLKNTKSKDVHRGDVIGTQGNTGYSFGDHLHFGVYKYSSFNEIDGWNWYYSNYIDPATKLKSKSVYWNTGCSAASTKNTGSGDWSWPLSNPTISQGFGKTCYSDAYYKGNPHPAFDMFGPYGSPVYAVADGKAYVCQNCLGDGANGVFIFHDKGFMTIYWHLR